MESVGRAGEKETRKKKQTRGKRNIDGIRGSSRGKRDKEGKTDPREREYGWNPWISTALLALDKIEC